MLNACSWVGVALAILTQYWVVVGLVKPASKKNLALNWGSFLLMNPVNIYLGAWQAIAISGFFCVATTVGYWQAKRKNWKAFQEFQGDLAVDWDATDG